MSGRFIRIPVEVLQTQVYQELTLGSLKLFLELLSQYNGYNNGKLTAAWSVLKNRGWNSKATLSKSIKQLKELGFIRVTRQGSILTSALYAVTWFDN